MKATGIVRRIDDLGRVVIPKEIRRTLRIRDGDPLEIFTEKDGGRTGLRGGSEKPGLHRSDQRPRYGDRCIGSEAEGADGSAADRRGDPPVGGSGAVQLARQGKRLSVGGKRRDCTRRSGPDPLRGRSDRRRISDGGPGAKKIPRRAGRKADRHPGRYPRKANRELTNNETPQPYGWGVHNVDVIYFHM